MDNSSEGKFMVAVGAILENPQTGNILMLKRSPHKDFESTVWEEVTGRMKQFETPEEAIKREVEEETGIKEIEIIKPIKISHFFRGEKNAENEIILMVYWCQTSEKQVTISEEHTEYKWISPHDALSLTDHPGIKSELEAFMAEHNK